VFAFGDRDEDLQLIKRHAAAPWRCGASDSSTNHRMSSGCLGPFQLGRSI